MLGIKKAKAAAAAPLRRIARPFNLKVARWILRRRAFWPFMALQTWPMLLVVALVLWSLTKAPPRDMRPWLYYVERSTRLVLVVGLLLEAYWLAKKRWRRLKASGSKRLRLRALRASSG